MLVRPRTKDLGIISLTHEVEVSTSFRPDKDDNIIDIGANIGAYAVRAAAVGARVISTEPNDVAYAVLYSTVKRNQLSSVELWYRAIGSYCGESILHIPSHADTRSSIVFVTDTSAIRTLVKIKTLDSVVSEVGLNAIDWFKVNVAGYQTEALRGAVLALKMTKRIGLNP